jgi:hypothetical protein
MGDDMIDALGSVDDAHCGTSGAVGVLLAVCCRLSFPRMGVAPAVGIVPWVQFDWQDSISPIGISAPRGGACGAARGIEIGDQLK